MCTCTPLDDDEERVEEGHRVIGGRGDEDIEGWSPPIASMHVSCRQLFVCLRFPRAQTIRTDTDLLNQPLQSTAQPEGSPSLPKHRHRLPTIHTFPQYTPSHNTHAASLLLTSTAANADAGASAGASACAKLHQPTHHALPKP